MLQKSLDHNSPFAFHPYSGYADVVRNIMPAGLDVLDFDAVPLSALQRKDLVASLIPWNQ